MDHSDQSDMLNSVLEENQNLQQQLTDVSRQLKACELRNQRYLESIPQVIWMANQQGKIQYLNQRWTEITGLAASECLGDQFLQAIHPEDRDRLLNEWSDRVQNQQPFQSNYRFLRPDGTVVWVLAQAIPERGERNEFIGYLGTITDISDHKLTELALQERAQELAQVNTILSQTTALLHKRNQELDQFAYVASHDLKAPLRAITNLSEWIEEDLEGLLPEENQQQMRLLRKRVHRMEALINGLLEYSRIGRTQTATETISVQELLTDLIEVLDPPSTFTLEIAPAMPTLTTKPLLLRQVFANLIGNAIAHHHQNTGHIYIGNQDRGPFIEFTVTDDGPGIDPQYHEKIFTIFQTLNSRDSSENTGIGLSIVKKIVETEGGTVQVESEVGQGATFRFTWLKRTEESE